MPLKPEEKPKDSIAPLFGADRIALLTVIGPAGGIGKTQFSDLLASFFEASDIPVRMIRVETGVRAGEFAEGDIVVDLDTTGEAATSFGGEASAFDLAWPALNWAIEGGGVTIIDGGANSHQKILAMMSATGIGELARANKRREVVVIMTVPDAEGGRQAVALVKDVLERLPGCLPLIAVNYLNPAQRPGVVTPQSREFELHMQAVARIPRIVVPFAGAQCLAAFGKSGTVMLAAMEADFSELVRMSGQGPVASLSAQTELGRWWNSIAGQLAAYFPPPAG